MRLYLEHIGERFRRGYKKSDPVGTLISVSGKDVCLVDDKGNKFVAKRTQIIPASWHRRKYKKPQNAYERTHS